MPRWYIRHFPVGPQSRIVKGECPTGGVHGQQLIGFKFLCFRVEDQIADILNRFSLSDSHIHLTGTGVEPDFFNLVDKFRFKIIFSRQIKMVLMRLPLERTDVEETNSPPSMTPRQTLFSTTIFPTFDFRRISTLFFISSSCIIPMTRNGSALKRINAFAHEIGENNSVGNGRILQRRTIGVHNRLDQKRCTFFLPGKKLSSSSPLVIALLS